GYESDARTEAQAAAKTEHVVTAFGSRHEESSVFDASEILKLIAGAESTTKKPHIAVVPAEGSIAMGSSSVLSDSGITARAMHRVIRRLAADDSVKAVVLRIDSPGGSALASDLMWHDLMELRKKKPLVTSVANMAASGGYYLACASTKIVAPETSIVGSIGVLGGKIVISDALAEFGVHAETFPASPAPGAAARAAYLSPLAPWDGPTREKVRKQMEQVYELFLRRVAEGRGLPVPLVRAVAEGRIWSGSQGLKIRLVDEIGGLGKALDIARKLGNVPADAPIVLDGIGETLLENLFGGSEGADEASVASRLASRRETYERLLGPIAGPLRPFVSSLAPLFAGETTLAVLPFGLVVK
ncbi:MAG TPA: signal peptide peptidase SppA, partial [Polyangiaceae bacterium]